MLLSAGMIVFSSPGNLKYNHNAALCDVWQYPSIAQLDSACSETWV